MSVNIQTSDGLKKIADKTTKKNIKNALGYTPADEKDLNSHMEDDVKHISSDERNKWNNQPDISNDSDDELLIVDKSGHIVAKIDNEGLHIIGIKIKGTDLLKLIEENGFSGNYNDLINKPSIDEGDDSTLYITDKNGLIAVKVDSDALDAHNLKIKGKQVATKEDILNAELNDITKEEILQDVPSLNSPSDEFAIVDNSGNIILKVDKEGLKTIKVLIGEKEAITLDALVDYAKKSEVPTKMSELEQDVELGQDLPIEDEDDKTLYVVDSAGNVILRIDGQGAHSTNFSENGINLKDKYASKDAIPTKTSQLTNDSDFTTIENVSEVLVGPAIDECKTYSDEVVKNKADRTELFDGSYKSLIDKPIENVDDDAEFHIADKNGHILASFTSSGLNVINLMENGLKLEDKYLLFDTYTTFRQDNFMRINGIFYAKYSVASRMDEEGNSFIDNYAKKTDLDSYLPLAGGTVSGRTVFLDEVSAFEFYEDNVPLSTKYALKETGVSAESTLTKDELLVGSDGTRKVVSSGYTVAQLIELINGKKNTFVVSSWESAFSDFDTLPSEQETYPASFTYASAETGIGLVDDTYAFLNTLKNGDVFLSTNTDEPDFFVSISALDGSIIFHKLETDVANLVNYLTIASAEATYAKKTELFDKDYNSLNNIPIVNEANDKTLTISDGSGNIIVRISNNGLDAYNLMIKGLSVATTLTRIETLAESKTSNVNFTAFKTTTENKFTNIDSDLEKKDTTLSELRTDVDLKLPTSNFDTYTEANDAKVNQIDGLTLNVGTSASNTKYLNPENLLSIKYQTSLQNASTSSTIASLATQKTEGVYFVEGDNTANTAVTGKALVVVRNDGTTVTQTWYGGTGQVYKRTIGASSLILTANPDSSWSDWTEVSSQRKWWRTTTGIRSSMATTKDIEYDSNVYSIDTSFMASEENGYPVAGDYIFDPYGSIWVVLASTTTQCTAIQRWMSTISWSACLEEGTMITMADGTYKKVEDVKIGESIMGYDFEKNKPTEAIAMFANQVQRDEKSTYILFDNGELLSLTDGHTLYSKSHGRYIAINGLKEGDIVLGKDGEDVTILSIHWDMYSFGDRQFYHIVSSNNTYYANNILNATHPVDRYNWIVNRMNLELPEEIVDIIREDSKEYECFDFTAKDKSFLKDALQHQYQIKKTINEIDEHKRYLLNTDYVALKFAEGKAVDPSVINKRQEARDSINVLQAKVEEHQTKYNDILEKYSDMGSDILLSDTERRAKYFKLACKRDNENLSTFKKYYIGGK